MSKKKLKKTKLKKAKTQKQIQTEKWDKLNETYKFKKVGIIKSVEFGGSPGSMFGAFGYMMDGPFGLHLRMIEADFGFPLSWTIPLDKCQEFFREMRINKDKDLLGKPVLCLSNSEALNYVAEVVPHIKLLEAWENE